MTHLVFSKEEISRSISQILRVVGLLGAKFIFLTPLGQLKFPGVSDFPVYINVVLLTNFPEQFELCFYFKYSRSLFKFYNLGDKTFETDFSFCENNNHWRLTTRLKENITSSRENITSRFAKWNLMMFRRDVPKILRNSTLSSFDFHALFINDRLHFGPQNSCC